MWLLYSPPVPLVRCCSVHDLPCHAGGVLGLWLSGEEDIVAEWLVDIRRYSPYAHLPVFVDCKLRETLQPFCDGVAISAEAALERALNWSPAVCRLQGTTPGPGLALARYLYLRPLIAVSPTRDWRRRQAYHYPLIEAFVDGESPEALLQMLRSRGWLEQTHLVDRLRQCGACQSIHLNYVDVCPGCQGINIEEAAYIHCFTCSHLAPEGSFACREALVCPNCHACLKHIGVDYNRPLEQFYCRDCAMAFSDATVMARCLECGAAHEPEALASLRVATYALSETGRHAARSGGAEGALVPRPRSCCVSIDAFIEVAEWVTSLSQRHAEAGYVLLGLRFFADSTQKAVEGEPVDDLLLDALSDRLRQLIRVTDILCRADRAEFWILLPHTSQSGGETLLKKVCCLVEHATQDRGAQINMRSAIRSAEDIPVGTAMDPLIGSIRRQLQGEVSC